MSQQQEQLLPEDGQSPPKEEVQQQQQQPQSGPEGHAGQGSDSAMKQMRIWEQRRASNSGGKRRHGPN
ncbi:hypothetical protein H8N03_13130 [Ramlibacter sp. USB13]|uniref:Uncharacterized protein n=1 Tax=Ramlibacter cellulosilyticus TaxID=2764187 RepID=A0A923MRI7_9BURK|nr:hypothetical protein [Ramlibacter cellulosilyticus]MBC5783893.1 hypothetical protein [Ramlibacter cellulosilyticus]